MDDIEITEAEPEVRGGDPLIGARLGSFRVVRPLGRGGMANVYLAVHTAIGSKVALKVLHPEMCADRALIEQFQAEAIAVNLIGHENIVKIFDFGELEENRPYLMMELLDGEPLSAFINNRTLDPKTAIPLLVQCCDALHAAHQKGVVHRDLKPDNIFLVPRVRAAQMVKLLDFGIAQLASLGARQGKVLGTPAYMAPEQWAGGTVDRRADIYALGVLAYRMLGGKKPFVGKGVRELSRAHRETIPAPLLSLNPRIPAELSRLVMRAMAKKPADRFSTAAELGAELEAVLGALELPPVPPVLHQHRTIELSSPSERLRLAVEAGSACSEARPARESQLPPPLPRSASRSSVPPGKPSFASIGEAAASAANQAARALAESAAQPPASGQQAPAQAASAPPEGNPGAPAVTAQAPATAAGGSAGGAAPVEAGPAPAGIVPATGAASPPAPRAARRRRGWRRIGFIGAGLVALVAFTALGNAWARGNTAQRHLVAAQQRIAVGQLSGQGDDTAVAHLRAARELAGDDDERVQRMSEYLSFQLVRQARHAAARGNVRDAASHYGAALLLTPERPGLRDEVSALETRLKSAEPLATMPHGQAQTLR